MRIAITGSSGLIGRALTDSLKNDGHTVVPVVRHGSSTSGETVAWDIEAGTIEAEGFDGLDGVVHLAGEGIAAGPWTKAQKARIKDSRTRGTALVAEAIAGLDNPPPVLVSASGKDYYGDGGDAVLTEESPAGHGFLPEVCQAWEAATGLAAAADVRVAHLRTSVVLSAGGGALKPQLLPFKLGLGPQMGNGRQWLPWVALDDVVGVIRFLLESDVAGPVNLAAPLPVTNAEFTDALGRALGRPTFLRVPKLVTRAPLGVGELLDNLMFTSSRVVPAVLQRTGYDFRYTDLDAALGAALATR